MPELPEVETVRAGLARHLTGRVVDRIEVLDARVLRQHEGGAEAFMQQLAGRTFTAAVRRGKFLWLPLDDGNALVAHLGMSGQLLVHGTAARTADAAARAAHAREYLGDPEAAHPDLTATRAPQPPADSSARPRHLRVRLHLRPAPGDAPDGAALDLVDQRMFGGLHLSALVPTADGAPGGVGSPAPLIPATVTHIARDLLDPHLDRVAVVAKLRRSSRAIKTLLMDQTLVSGVGNIYADEGLWAARLHGRRRGNQIGPRVAARLLDATGEVMERALAAGGTSFDALYVDADGAAGFFARSLAVYGRAGQPCRRCGTALRTETIGGRSHVFCPRCHTRPRNRRA
ncbi:bifunctional DNA-formamidopyrimidine glycosylase/DNA-(apurinic or apyrimidinic site) lyase [Actinomyces sp. MRS3W]|uniref:bifunctional DNA-formamidopyrimidine glycosylase/DNA-(apurinic or apyrimidinic site) lyase n=1 Tax=Actinomyces sp. MRS3W TaxID=2800796 RepID=UPI0028FD91FC|nr:bifunctional DNA-formamidopyrimidine glycosylase/DNA-(apurinic or apyrimidinic site) lyase [Actinomyces sp. MRS3W]MDU0347297.1 bifunctional DNA-formamidopyrimidine glycosylase/DNA-(apurinic or apyrimidinic site) lyase [Actinomyces sp. MRS3W]